MCSYDIWQAAGQAGRPTSYMCKCVRGGEGRRGVDTLVGTWQKDKARERQREKEKIRKTKADNIGDLHDVLFISLEIDTAT